MDRDRILRLAKNAGFTPREISDLSDIIVCFYLNTFEESKNTILTNIEAVKRSHKKQQRLDVAAKATLRGIEECITTTRNTTLIATNESA